MPDSLIETLIQESTEEIFPKDSYIFKDGDRVQYIYLIKRGGGYEFYNADKSSFRIPRSVGHVLPLYEILQV